MPKEETNKSNNKNLFLILIVILAVVIVAAIIVVFNSFRTKTVYESYPPLTASNIEIESVNWDLEKCQLKISNCEKETSGSETPYINISNGKSACGELTVTVTPSDDILNKATYYQSRVNCILNIDGNRYPTEGSPYVLNPGYNIYELSVNLDLYKDNAIQLCCKGSWEGVEKDYTACQNVNLVKFCDISIHSFDLLSSSCTPSPNNLVSLTIRNNGNDEISVGALTDNIAIYFNNKKIPANCGNGLGFTYRIPVASTVTCTFNGVVGTSSLRLISSDYTLDSSVWCY